MNDFGKETNTQPLFKNRFFYLIVAIMAMILVNPIFREFIRLRFLLDIFFTVIFISGIYAISYKKQHILFAALLALPMIISLWAKYIFVSDYVIIVGRFFGILFFGFAVVHASQFILKAENVTKDVLFAAIVVYLMIALMWTFIYSLLELIHSGSFSIPDTQIQEASQHFLYFSFVTITTLGYGDITPVTEVAKSLAVVEAVVGQIYLVVVVAWLVGMHVSKKSR
ncbi:MAG: hypothetical protein HKO68_12500 [Desulfobacterales bacterium]|nr:hypothetical protein [Desulfobacterales bacterium]